MRGSLSKVRKVMELKGRHERVWFPACISGALYKATVLPQRDWWKPCSTGHTAIAPTPTSDQTSLVPRMLSRVFTSKSVLFWLSNITLKYFFLLTFFFTKFIEVASVNSITTVSSAHSCDT